MRISQKIILAVTIAIAVSVLSDFLKVQNSIDLVSLFDELIEAETPSLTALIEIKSSVRQASLKAVEYSIRGNKTDKNKALQAIQKVKLHLSNYADIEKHDLRSTHSDLNKLNTLVDKFILTTINFLTISTGPSLTQLTRDESKLHKARKKLITITKNLKNNDTELLLEKIKSEARKISLKSIEYYLRGIPEDKDKAFESINKLNILTRDFNKSNNETDIGLLKPSVSAYITSAISYINDISERKSPVSKIYSTEKELNQSRRTLIHNLYDLIEIEQLELRKAGARARDSIDSLVSTTIIAAIILTLVLISMGIIIYRAISKPITHLINAAHDIGAGNLDARINTNSNDEIRELADAFNEMSGKLKSSHTERQQALSALQENEQDLSITLDSIGDAVITADANGYVTRMNPVAEKLTGWSIKEAKNKKLNIIFPIIDASTREVIENPIEKVMNSGEIVYLSNHTTLISRDGTEYQIADSAAPIRDKNNNKTLGIVLVFNDVTEQYNLKQTVIESKNNLQSIMDNTPVIIYVKDKEGRFTFINRKFSDLFHITNDEIYGKTLHDIFPKDIADEMRKNDIDVLETGHALESEEYSQINEVVHTYSSTRFPLKNENNEIYAICGISTDITDRKLKEEQLRRSQKMDALGKLTGGIAHDFNNMLGIILGYSELIEQTTKDNKALTSYIQEIHKAGERGAKLTKKLLSFSRQKTTDLKAYDINELIKDQQHMLEKTLTARIQLKLDLADDLWPVLVDNSDLEDAIVNISINAMHAIEGNGQLCIHTYNESINETDAKHLNIAAGDYVLLSLTDNGCGMNHETREKIFDPFYTTKGEKGTGLGLSQVYGFVENSKGTIRVYSEPGHGSRFTLYFPRDVSIQKDNNHNHDNDEKQYTGHEHILIVDDEPSLLQLASKILTIHGYTTYTAESGKQALAILKEKKIDLMLSDVIMPEMDGYELAKIVLDKYPDVKIQMASGFSDDRHENILDQSLHNQLLHKPYHSMTLLKRLRELLD